MSTRSDRAADFIQKWAISFIVLVAYYFFSFNISSNAYNMTHLPPGEEMRCGMPLLGCVIGQVIITALALAIIVIRMVLGKNFSRKNYWWTFALLLLPLVPVIYFVFY